MINQALQLDYRRYDFMEYSGKYVKCGWHVKKWARAGSILFMVLCLIFAAFCLASMLLPEGHRLLDIERINLEYKRNRGRFMNAYKACVCVCVM